MTEATGTVATVATMVLKLYLNRICNAVPTIVGGWYWYYIWIF
jgi:hypothetical protein